MQNTRTRKYAPIQQPDCRCRTTSKQRMKKGYRTHNNNILVVEEGKKPLFVNPKGGFLRWANKEEAGYLVLKCFEVDISNLKIERPGWLFMWSTQVIDNYYYEEGKSNNGGGYGKYTTSFFFGRRNCGVIEVVVLKKTVTTSDFDMDSFGNFTEEPLVKMEIFNIKGAIPEKAKFFWMRKSSEHEFDSLITVEEVSQKVALRDALKSQNGTIHPRESTVVLESISEEERTKRKKVLNVLFD